MARFFTQSTVKPILIVRDKQVGTKNDYICTFLKKIKPKKDEKNFIHYCIDYPTKSN